MDETAQSTFRIVVDGTEAGWMRLLVPSLNEPRRLPGFPGEQDGFALYLTVNDLPLAGVAFPVVEETIQLSNAAYLIWPEAVKERPAGADCTLVRNEFRADHWEGGDGREHFRADFWHQGGRGELHARLGGTNQWEQAHLWAHFWGTGGGLNELHAIFRGNGVSGGPGAFHAHLMAAGPKLGFNAYFLTDPGSARGGVRVHLDTPQVELSIRTMSVNLWPITQLLRYSFLSLATLRQGTLTLCLERVSYNADAAALHAEAILGAGPSSGDLLQRQINQPETPSRRTKFSVTFDNGVPAKELASLLAFIHQRAIDKGGSGLLFLPKKKEEAG